MFSNLEPSKINKDHILKIRSLLNIKDEHRVEIFISPYSNRPVINVYKQTKILGLFKSKKLILSKDLYHLLVFEYPYAILSQLYGGFPTSHALLPFMSAYFNDMKYLKGQHYIDWLFEKVNTLKEGIDT